MDNAKLIEALDKINSTLNGIGGRLLVAAMRDKTVKEAHEMVIAVGIDLDDLINDLLEQEG